MPNYAISNSRAGRKPRASLRRLTPAVFVFLTRRVMHMRTPSRIEAARLHMVEGMTMAEASLATDVPTNALENVRKAIADKDDVLAPVYSTWSR
ncbi:hypothetical protein GALL_493910 [mine drainage metagenome]|uniref:Uncharacterized protein n=1 Tax=mine drainage metagenome TaxID=410659 RepID=A0A1J5PN46_9ZZZZ